MSRVNLLDSYGEPVNVAQEDVPQAMAAGYKVPSPAQVSEVQKQQTYGEGLGNELKAFGAGAARSASFGLSDYLLPKVPGGPTAEDLTEWQKRNPVSDTVGGIAGVGASLLLPGGGLVGGASKLATSAGEAIANRTAGRVLSKFASSAVGSGVLGSLYGAGNVVSEAALGDPDLNSQKALAQVGLSGLLSGVIGVGATAAKLGFPKAMDLAKNAHSLADGVLKKEKLLFDPFSKTVTPTNAIANVTEEASDSGLVKGMARYAVDAAKNVLPHGAVTAFETVMDASSHLLKAETLAGIESLINKTTDNIATAANNIFKVSPDLTPFLGSKLSKAQLNQDYDKVTQKVQELSDPTVFMDKIDAATKEVYPHAPQITNHMQMTMASATQYLNEKMPKPSVQTPLSEPFVASDAQKQDFLHSYNIVNNPLLALNEVKQGTLTKATIDALTAVHPKLYADMRQVLMGKLMEVKAKNQLIPYQTKAMLTQFMQDPLDTSFLPSSIMATQKVFMGPQKSNQGTGGTNSRSMGSGSRLSALNVAGRATLPTQKVNLGQKL